MAYRDDARKGRPDHRVPQRHVDLRDHGLALCHHSTLCLDLFAPRASLEDTDSFLRALALRLRQCERGLEVLVLLPTDGTALVQSYSPVGILTSVLESAFGRTERCPTLGDLLLAEAALQLVQSGSGRRHPCLGGPQLGLQFRSIERGQFVTYSHIVPFVDVQPLDPTRDLEPEVGFGCLDRAGGGNRRAVGAGDKDGDQCHDGGRDHHQRDDHPSSLLGHCWVSRMVVSQAGDSSPVDRASSKRATISAWRASTRDARARRRSACARRYSV